MKDQAIALRAKRLERLHSLFLELSRAHEELFHVAANPKDTDFRQLLSPVWLGEYKDTPLHLAGVDAKTVETCWRSLIGASSRRNWLGYDSVDEDPMPIPLGNGFSMIGKFVCPSYEIGTYDVSEPTSPHCGIAEFEKTASLALVEVSSEFSNLWIEDSIVPNDYIRWLSVLYWVLEPNIEAVQPWLFDLEKWEHNPKSRDSSEPLLPIDLTYLPANIFESSAKCLEILMDRKSQNVLETPSAIGNPAEPNKGMPLIGSLDTGGSNSSGSLSTRDVKWIGPKSPQEWEKIFKVSWRTIKRRIDRGEILAKEINSKSWKIESNSIPNQLSN